MFWHTRSNERTHMCKGTADRTIPEGRTLAIPQYELSRQPSKHTQLLVSTSTLLLLAAAAVVLRLHRELDVVGHRPLHVIIKGVVHDGEHALRRAGVGGVRQHSSQHEREGGQHGLLGAPEVDELERVLALAVPRRSDAGLIAMANVLYCVSSPFIATIFGAIFGCLERRRS